MDYNVESIGNTPTPGTMLRLSEQGERALSDKVKRAGQGWVTIYLQSPNGSNEPMEDGDA